MVTRAQARAAGFDAAMRAQPYAATMQAWFAKRLPLGVESGAVTDWTHGFVAGETKREKTRHHIPAAIMGPIFTGDFHS